MGKANLTCPHCGYTQQVEIPQTSCLAFHKCEKCQKIISLPKKSKNCCVICEYSDKKCPGNSKTSTNQTKIYSLKISTFIKSDCPTVFKVITNLKLLSLFFPIYVFSSDEKNLNKIGQDYTAKIDNLITERYKIIDLKENFMISAQLISTSKIFSYLAYTHRLLPTQKGVISEEIIKYSLRYGIWGKILNFFIIAPFLRYFIKKAHQRLKIYCEKL